VPTNIAPVAFRAAPRGLLVAVFARPTDDPTFTQGGSQGNLLTRKIPKGAI